MKAYVFSDDSALEKVKTTADAIRSLLEQVAEDTDTKDLVVAVYLTNRDKHWRGEAIAELQAREEFCTARGWWSCNARFGTPSDLPDKFHIIRLSFGLRLVRYPRKSWCPEHWAWRWNTFQAHLACLFAHELFHYRRFHLGLDPGAGEVAADRWSLSRMREIGLDVTGQPPRRRKRRRTKPSTYVPTMVPRPALLLRIKRIAARLSPGDLRELAAWTQRRREELIQRLLRSGQ